MNNKARVLAATRLVFSLALLAAMACPVRVFLLVAVLPAAYAARAEGEVHAAVQVPLKSLARQEQPRTWQVAHYSFSYQDCTTTCTDATVCEVDGKSKFSEQVLPARG